MSIGLKFSIMIVSIVFSLDTLGEGMNSKVTFKVNGSLSLNGQISVPSNKTKKYPAVLVLEGSGQSPLKERPVNDSFIQLITKTGENEIIGFHYNKRGSGENSENGKYLASGFYTHVDDALAALNYLKKIPYVDEDQIYLMGQSIGGMLATQVALREKVAGLILYTSPARPLTVFMPEQNRLISKYMGKTQDEIDKYVNGLERDLFKMESGNYVCEAPNCGLIDGEEVYEEAESVKLLVEVAQSNQISNLEKVRLPTLLIHGTSDFIIPVTDSELAYKALNKYNSDVTLEIIEGLDHFFADNKSKEDSFKYVLSAQKNSEYQDINKKLINKLMSWLKHRLN